MPTSTIQLSVSVGGVSVAGTVSRTASGQRSEIISLPAADAGTLTGRTDADTGVATLTTGHSIANQNVVDVYWTGGIRYGMLATVATNAVTLEGGAGANLPTAQTAVALCAQVTVALPFDGDLIEMIGAVGTRRGHTHFEETGSASALAQELIATEPWTWVSDQGVTNPFATKDVTEVHVSNGDSAGTSTITIGLLIDSDS
jgi:hypothetical protein